MTALPPLAAYHDLRWLFAFNQSWLSFTGVLVLLFLARSALDAVLLMLAWPRAGPPRPRFLPSVLSCAVLTVLVWLVMSPVVTLMFGVALLPFSWLYLAAVPILLGTALALSQGGAGQAWWRRLPPVRTVVWLLTTFAVLSVASVLMTRLDSVAVVAVAGLAGVVDARAWYGLTAAAIRRSVERPPHPWHWRAALWRRSGTGRAGCRWHRWRPSWCWSSSSARPASRSPGRCASPPEPVMPSSRLLASTPWPEPAGWSPPAHRQPAVRVPPAMSPQKDPARRWEPAVPVIPPRGAVRYPGRTARCSSSRASGRPAAMARAHCGPRSPGCSCAGSPTWA